MDACATWAASRAPEKRAPHEGNPPRGKYRDNLIVEGQNRSHSGTRVTNVRAGKRCRPNNERLLQEWWRVQWWSWSRHESGVRDTENHVSWRRAVQRAVTDASSDIQQLLPWGGSEKGCLLRRLVRGPAGPPEGSRQSQDDGGESGGTVSGASARGEGAARMRLGKKKARRVNERTLAYNQAGSLSGGRGGAGGRSVDDGNGEEAGEGARALVHCYQAQSQQVARAPEASPRGRHRRPRASRPPLPSRPSDRSVSRGLAGGCCGGRLQKQSRWSLLLSARGPESWTCGRGLDVDVEAMEERPRIPGFSGLGGSGTGCRRHADRRGHATPQRISYGAPDVKDAVGQRPHPGQRLRPPSPTVVAIVWRPSCSRSKDHQILPPTQRGARDYWRLSSNGT